MPVSRKSKKNLSKKRKNVKLSKKTRKHIRKMRGGGINNLNASNTNVLCDLLTEEQKNILHIYVGISTDILSNISERPINNDTDTVKTLYFGKNKNNITKKFINSSKTFKKLYDIESFFEGTKLLIRIYELKINDTTYLILYFPTGVPVSSYDYFDNLNNYDGDINILAPLRFYTNNRDNLIKLIDFINPYLKNVNYSKIILSGHSNGMSAATMFAYILYILALPDEEIKLLPKEQNAVSFINPITLLPLPRCIDIKNEIKSKIYICGTAGFPCLFSNRDEFDKFNNFYNKKYIHIISGLKNLDVQIYDKIACVNLPAKNFGSIIFNMNNKTMECLPLENILKERDQIDENTTTYNKTKTDIHAFNFYRYLYNKYFSRKTKNNTVFNTW